VNWNTARRSRRALEILGLAAAVAVAVALIAFADARVGRWMETLKERSIAMVENYLGRPISYRSISPSVFGYLAVRDLSVHSIDPREPPLLRLSRVTIHYNLWRLLVSGDPVQAVSTIHLAKSSVEVDLERDRELLELLARLAAIGRADGSRAGLASLPQLSLSGSDISLRYRQREWSAGADNLFFTIRGAGEVYQINLRCSLNYQLGSQPSAQPTISSRLRISGRVDRGLAWSDLAVRIDALSTAALSLKRQTFQLTYDGNVVKLNKVQDRAPLDIQFAFDRQTGKLDGRFNAESFKPASLIQLSGPLSAYDQWLASSLTASGSVSIDTRNAGMNYQADLELMPAEGLIPVDLFMVSHLYGTEKMLVLQPLIVHSPQGTLEFSGDLLLDSLMPAGLLRLSDIQASAGPPLSASLELQRTTEGTLSVRADQLRLGDSTFSAFSLKLDPRKKEIPFEVAAALTDPGEVGSVGAIGRLVLGAKPSLSFDARLHGISVDSLSELLGMKSRLSPYLAREFGGLILSLDFSLDTDFNHYSLSSEDVEIYQRSDPGNAVRFAFDLSDDAVKVKGLTAKWKEYSLAGEAEARLWPWQTEFSTSFSFQGLPYQIKGTILQGRRLEIEGSYGLRVAVLSRGMVDPELLPTAQQIAHGTTFSFQASELPIPLASGKVLLSTDLQGAVTASGSVYARSGKTVLVDIPFLPLKQNQLQVSFLLQKDRLSLEKLSYRDRISSVSGSGNLVVGGLAPLAVEGRLNLQDSRNSERYSINTRIAEGKANIVLDFNRSPLARMGELPVSGDLAGSLTLKGNLSAPELAANLRLQDGKISADPLAAELLVSYRDNLLTLNALNVSLLTHRFSDGRGQWDLRQGIFAFSSKYSSDYLGSPVRMDLELKGNLDGGAQANLMANPLAQSMDASLRLTNILVEKRSFPDWLVRLQSREGILSLDGGPNDAIHGKISRSGSFNLQLLPPLPMQVNAAGRLQGNSIEADLLVNSIDMRLVNEALRSSTRIIEFTKGHGSGNLRISGLVTDPDWFGTLTVRDASMRFLLSPDPVEPIDGQLVFDEKNVYMPRVASRSGKVKVEGEGSFSMDHWVPRSFELAFYVSQNPGAHMRYTFPPVFLDGFATGAVRVRGDEVSTRVEGTLTANQCRIALVRPEEPASAPEVPLSVDLKIAAGRGVEFYWPALNFPVVHTYAKQGDQVNVVVDGETGQMTLTGSVDIRGGEIFYFDRSFYLKRGNIRFDSNPGEVDPWINAQAEIRERDQDNEEVRIYLEANNRLSQFSPRFYSDPVLTDLEVMSLIGGNVFNRYGDSRFGLSAVMLTTDIVGQFGLLAPLERVVRRALDLDLFSIRTQFLQSLLIGRILGDSSISGTLNPLDNTTLSLGKYVGTDLFVQALVRFQTFQDMNSAYNIQTEGELRLEWTTPFFLLEWVFTPQHPENLFLSDNSIGLSWKFSY
jgi:translocation and assembly module TamB